MISTLLATLIAATPSGTVTVPLSEMLPLIGKSAESPPVSAVVVSQQLTAQVTPEAVALKAKWVVTVLDGSKWAQLELLKMPAGLALEEVSMVDKVTVAVRQGALVLISQAPGTYTIEAKITARGATGPIRTVRIERGRDGLEGVMRLESEETNRELFSDNGAWHISWRSEATKKEAVQVARPPMEPTVTQAHAQVVSTVEGRARLTMGYALSLDRPQTFTIQIPEGWVGTRLSVNGEARPVPAGRAIAANVEPSRSGAKEAVVEVTLEREFGVFHLSGRLALAFPAVSWPTSLLDVSVHLPTVFEYRRLGGSLEPAIELAWSPASMPGRQLLYQQHLIASAGPTLELAYSVDLKDRYFKTR